MKKIITVLLVTALVVFSAYFTFKKVKDKAGSMVSHIVKEQPASVPLPVAEEALSRKTGNKAKSADDIKGKTHLRNKLPAPDEGLNVKDEETLETLLAEDVVEGPVKGALSVAREEEKVAAVEDADKVTLPAAGAEEKGAALPVKEVNEAPVKQALPAGKGLNAEDKEKADALPAKGVSKDADKVTLPAAGAEEKRAALPVKEVNEAPVKQAVSVGKGLNAEDKEKADALPASGKWSSAEAEKRIAILSFENFSDDANALDRLMPALKERLERKGLTVVGERRVSRFLCGEKIRFTSYISNEMIRKVRDKFMVKTILAGSVISYSSKETPQIGLILRLIDSSTGSIVWADYVSVSGDDFATVLGLGNIKKMEDLIPRALDKLFVSFRTSTIREKPESVYRIVVLPFQNKSGFNNAGMITMYMFMVELFKNYKFEPIEYGEVRRLIVDLRIRNKGELEYKNLEGLSESVNMSGVLVGTVEQYSAGTDASSPVNVAITARLLDARKNRILWYNSHESNGGKKIISFEWGGPKPVDKVAYEVVSGLVEEMNAAKWH